MPLSPQQLKHLERRLRDERTRLLTQLQDFVAEESSEDSQQLAGDLSKQPMHPADLGTDVANEELEASVATRRSAEIGEIDAALARLTTSPDTFGRDEQTGADIPFARLDIIPYARTNVAT
jgi:DnaK suppressor protein